MAQARETAMLSGPDGKIKSGEMEREDGRLVYSFDITTGHAIREVLVDAQSGVIVKEEKESESGESERKKPVASDLKLPVTMTQAHEAALAYNPSGKIMSGELERENGQWVYSIKMAMDGVTREVSVDAQTGAVVKDEVDSNDNDNDNDNDHDHDGQNEDRD